MKNIILVTYIFCCTMSANSQENAFPATKTEMTSVSKDQPSKIVGDTVVLGNDAFFLSKEGLVFKGDADEAVVDYLSTIIYSKQCPTDPFADVPNPVWANDVNEIYIDCPPVQVGIGNNEPRTRLDVTGGIYGGVVMIGQDPSTAEGRLHINTQLSETNSNNVIIVENNDRRILQLDNSGLLRTREIKLDALPWADYVFHDDYVLIPLSEVEKYIEENGHLPNVPSEEEVEEEGIDLGEMNKILLEKVEELTLYMIEQQKQIDDLKEQIQNK